MDITDEVNQTPLQVGKAIIRAIEITVEQSSVVLTQQSNHDLAAPTLTAWEKAGEALQKHYICQRWPSIFQPVSSPCRVGCVVNACPPGRPCG